MRYLFNYSFRIDDNGKTCLSGVAYGKDCLEEGQIAAISSPIIAVENGVFRTKNGSQYFLLSPTNDAERLKRDALLQYTNCTTLVIDGYDTGIPHNNILFQNNWSFTSGGSLIGGNVITQTAENREMGERAFQAIAKIDGQVVCRTSKGALGLIVLAQPHLAGTREIVLSLLPDMRDGELTLQQPALQTLDR